MCVYVMERDGWMDGYKRGKKKRQKEILAQWPIREHFIYLFITPLKNRRRRDWEGWWFGGLRNYY